MHWQVRRSVEDLSIVEGLLPKWPTTRKRAESARGEPCIARFSALFREISLRFRVILIPVGLGNRPSSHDPVFSAPLPAGEAGS